MDKQIIEEMAKEIARILFEDCLLNMGGRCEDCEWNGKETKEYDCQSLLVAKKLLEKYQPKIPEGAVVLTQKELIKMQLKYYNGGAEETAKKFAEMAKKSFFGVNCINIDEWNWYNDKLDEICKEITEG